MNTSLSIRRLTKEDAPLVGELFRAVYGEGYPLAYVYNPAELWKQNVSGDTCSILAFDGQGRPLGHMAVFRAAFNKRVYENGQLLVLPESRGSGIASKMLAFTHDILVKEIEIDALFCEAVCNHCFSQQVANAAGYSDTALEIDLMPAEAYAKEGSSKGRVACVLQFRECAAPGGKPVFIPRCYRRELPLFLQGLAARTIREAEDSSPQGRTQVSEKIYDFAAVAKITVENIGADFGVHVEQWIQLAAEHSIKAMQVYLPLQNAAVGAAVDILRANGFFLGGILPFWFGGDGLLMQRLWVSVPSFAETKLNTVKAGKLLEIIRADWQSRQVQP